MENEEKDSIKCSYFQGYFQKDGGKNMIFYYQFLYIFAILLSLSIGSTIRKRSIFHPYTDNSTNKTLAVPFIFRNLSYFGRFVHVEFGFVRHYHNNLPRRELISNVYEYSGYGKNFVLLVNNSEKEFQQSIIFDEGNYASHNYSIDFINLNSYDFINYTLVYNNIDTTDIAGLNYYYFHANYPIQCFLDVAKFSFLLSLIFSIYSYYEDIVFYIEINSENGNKKFSKFQKTTLFLGLTAIFSLNPLSLILHFSVVRYATPFFISFFYLIFRIYSIDFLRITFANDYSYFKNHEKKFKIFTIIYTLLEFKDIWNLEHSFYVFNPSSFEKSIISWIMIIIHLVYGYIGFNYAHRLYKSQKQITSFSVNLSFYLIYIIYTVSLFTTILVNCILNIILPYTIVDTVFPTFLFHFSYIASAIMYIYIAHSHNQELDRFLSKN